MKSIKVFITVLLLTVIGINVSAGNHKQTQTTGTKTESLKVWGSCEMCKDRIEKAAKLEGVTAAVWDQKSSMLTVTFDPKKTNIEAIGKKVASVGHDTEKFKAPDEVYLKLPGCCHYERSK